VGPGPAFDFAAAWLIGFLGSLHCLGMCGPIIIAYSLHSKSYRNPVSNPNDHKDGYNPPNPPLIKGGKGGFQMNFGASILQGELLHHLAFHLGRVMTYGFLGALAGFLFNVASLDRFFLHLRAGMTLAGGVLMVFLGLVLLRVIPVPRLVLYAAGGVDGKGSIGRLLGTQTLSSRVVLGMAVGFLPCGLSWAMIVKAATTHNIGAGFMTMVSFGMGTVPALLLPGVSASLLSLRLRILGERLAAFSVIAMGLILVFKGARIFA
jgi:uncharacterized protein